MPFDPLSGKPAAQRRTTVSALPGDAFSPTDLRRLDEVVRDARSASTAQPSALLSPLATNAEATALTSRNCVFDHCAVLLFPTTIEAGLHHLERHGLAPRPAVPSTVVRRRLSARHGVHEDLCDVRITRLCLDLPTGRRHPAVEVFLFPRDSPSFTERIEADEVAYGYENHTAFVMDAPRPAVIERLVGAWRTDAGLLWEGGGHNPHEGGPDGSTVLYFVRAAGHPGTRRRFELNCPGNVREFTARAVPQDEGVHRAYRAWPRLTDDVPA
ncbi:hypothetical protein ACIBUY_39385 [Streptomyces sp. NPDC050085]|uniref:hypothetical protein n=1 Tax=Streptomyces sp. NPDC050085 TaxID=3365600 RepID=UPI00379A06F9